MLQFYKVKVTAGFSLKHVPPSKIVGLKYGLREESFDFGR